MTYLKNKEFFIKIKTLFSIWINVSQDRKIRKKALKHPNCNSLSFEEFYCSTTGEPLGVRCKNCQFEFSYLDVYF